MIEVEIRSFISEEKFNELLAFFGKNGKKVSEDTQETHYFDSKEDLRIQKNNFYSKIWMKKGKLHDDQREEIELKVGKDDFEKLGTIFEAAGLKVIDVVLESNTALIANPVAAADPVKAHAMGQILTLLQGALDARSHVLVKLNVAEADLEAVIALLPSLKSPTVSKLFGEGGFAIETVVPKSTINVLIPALKDRGATDILEVPLAKIVH